MAQIRQSYNILSAVDVCQEPSESNQPTSNTVSGRLLDIEAGEDDEDGRLENSSISRNRCLKLGLGKIGTGDVHIGIELTRLNWSLPIDTLLGKTVHSRIFQSRFSCVYCS